MTNTNRPLRHASLFSGIGGPEVAASMLGWENVFHCEIDPFGRSVLEYWFPNSDSYEDITKTDFRKYRGHVDVLSGGFPCQPFSTAGKRKGAGDDRYLWPEMLRVIDEVRPSWVVGENVAGIASMVEPGEVVDLGCEATLFSEGDGVHRYMHRGGFTVERICSDLEQAGYSVQPVLIPACAVGAPHRRDRVFFIAHCDSNRCWKRQDKQVSVSERNSQAYDSNGCQAQNASDPKSSGNHRGPYSVLQEERRQEKFNAQHNLNGRVWLSSDPHSIMPKRRLLQGQERRDKKDIGAKPPFCNRDWAEFPTAQPAIRRGDDGIPFDVDNLAIPFAKWRTESIKAYGNAIVPQVIYEIFKAIDNVENK